METEYKNTDTVLWNGFDFRVFKTQQGSLGISVGGLAIVKSIGDWHSQDTENARLREALEKLSENDVPRPVAVHYAKDKSPHKGDRCVHARFMYEDCEQCVADFASAALKESE